MSDPAVLIALLAVVLSLVAIWMAKQAGGAAPGAPQRRAVTLTGSVRVINDCDGLQASIPAAVKIDTELADANGNAIGGSTTVNLGPDPNDPNGPVKVANYTITVNWPKVLGAPVNWKRPEVLDAATGQPVCRSIACPNPGQCQDLATGGRVIPFADPQTSHDIRVACACS
jgi:hypothetical protein